MKGSGKFLKKVLEPWFPALVDFPGCTMYIVYILHIWGSYVRNEGHKNSSPV